MILHLSKFYGRRLRWECLAQVLVLPGVTAAMLFSKDGLTIGSTVLLLLLEILVTIGFALRVHGLRQGTWEVRPVTAAEMRMARWLCWAGALGLGFTLRYALLWQVFGLHGGQWWSLLGHGFLPTAVGLCIAGMLLDGLVRSIAPAFKRRWRMVWQVSSVLALLGLGLAVSDHLNPAHRSLEYGGLGGIPSAVAAALPKETLLLPAGEAKPYLLNAPDPRIFPGAYREALRVPLSPGSRQQAHGTRVQVERVFRVGVRTVVEFSMVRLHSLSPQRLAAYRPMYVLSYRSGIKACAPMQSYGLHQLHLLSLGQHVENTRVSLDFFSPLSVLGVEESWAEMLEGAELCVFVPTP